jgi:predicted nucleic acid-binding protein
MSSVYVDTSALVKFYYPEQGSDGVEQILLEADRVYISRLTVVEMASALTQKVRTGDLTKRTEALIWTAFQDDLHAGKVEMVPLQDRHYSKAADIIREHGRAHGIKILDALHLSIAHGLQQVSLLCTDKVLLRVAAAMGIRTTQR